VSSLLQGRSSKACSHRWSTFLDPEIKHPRLEPLTDWEVAVIMQAQLQYGNRWKGMRKRPPVGGCAGRVVLCDLGPDGGHRHLVPGDSPLMPAPLLCHRPAVISKLLPGRSNSAVKNYWHSTLSKQQKTVWETNRYAT